MKEMLQIIASLQNSRRTVGLELPADEPPMCTVESSMSVASKVGDNKIQIADDSKLFPIGCIIRIGTMQRMEERKVTGHGSLMFGVGLRWPFEPSTGVFLATDAPTAEDDGASADESDEDLVTDDGSVRLTVGRGAAASGGTSSGNDSGDQTDMSQHMRLTNGAYESKFKEMKFTDIPNNYQDLEDRLEENGEEILKHPDRTDE